MKKATRYSLITLLLCATVVALYLVYSRYSGTPEPTYATETVRRGAIEQTVLANGMLQASKLVSVGAQASGQIQTLPVSLGQELKKGELVAEIDSLTQQNSLKEAEASLKSIDAQIRAKRAQIQQAQLEYERQQRMLKADASARADFESAEATLTVYRADLEQLHAQREQAVVSVDSAKVDLSYTRITAPMDGTVVYTAVEVGQTVNANQSTPTIIEMAQLDKMTVKAELSEADVINIYPEQPVYFTILGQPQHRYHATLRAIEPGPTSMDGDDSDMTSSDSDAIYYNGLFDVDNPDRTLRIGMTAEVSIVLAQADNALLVPAQVLIAVNGATDSTEKRYQVPILKDGKLEYRPVKVGINNKIYAEITDGLQEGDLVVTGSSAGDGNVFQPRSPMGF